MYSFTNKYHANTIFASKTSLKTTNEFEYLYIYEKKIKLSVELA